MNINALNDDCLSTIFSYIPLKQLILGRRVCTHWRQTIDNYLTNERHLVYNQSINGTKRDQYFYKYKDNVEALLDLNQFECCVQLMPKLTALTLRGIKANDAMLPIMATNCPNITRLHVLSGEESLTFVGFKYLCRKYPLLTHLDLPNCQLDDDLIHIIATSLHELTHFNFATDRNRAVRNYRLSRFTGQTLRHIAPRIRSLMIGESMYWDEQLIQSLMTSAVRHTVTTLQIHLIKLKSLRAICDGMPQLREFYCSFNGGDINTHENNVGCVRHLHQLKNLEALELIDDGRHHCGINGCHSVYTLSTLMEAVNGMSRLRVLRLIDFDNWHSQKPNIDPLLAELKRFCPHLVEFAISAGLFQLKTESYGLIGLLDVPTLTIQGDSSLQVADPPYSSKHNYLTNEVVVDLLKATKSLRRLKVENSQQIDEEAINGCLEVSAARSRRQIELIFCNIRLNSVSQITTKLPENVSLVVNKDEEVIDLDDYTDGSSSSFDTSDSDSIHLFSDDDDFDGDI
ncbi:unnamed protein product [Medioppia subpectinata]|uniref:F-box domain-containing protein n=1 Tax=Medioppia subpectinata TaxID=1979941 RepID=A0A7R9PWC5_9ACAR|nr:unnamed protein product [Medioppia subpectinata]CAG2103566.1 unnamed protein product [Medioppia subpectinata]